MASVQDIINALDDEIIFQKKSFLSLAQANKILLNRGIFQESDISNKTLKRLLEEQKIPNAHQTLHEPKQWRIVLSFLANEQEDNELHTIINQEEQEKDDNVILDSSSGSKIKEYFEKYGQSIVIVFAVLIIISLVLLKIKSENTYHNSNKKELTKKELRIEQLKSIVNNVINNSDWGYPQWKFLAKIQSAEDEYNGDRGINVILFPTSLLNDGMLIYTSNIYIPRPSVYAKKDPIYGLPMSFFYKFYFDRKDSVTAKYLVVVYDSSKTCNYDFSQNPVQRLINTRLASLKIDKWEREKKKLEDKQKKELKKQEEIIKKSEQARVSATSKICQKEKKYISDVYRMLMRNINDLEYQYKRLSYTELARYINEWNRNADEIRTQYHQSEFNCFFAFDFNVMLSSYEQAGREFINVLDGTDNGDYYNIKSKITENYNRLMDSYSSN